MKLRSTLHNVNIHGCQYTSRSVRLKWGILKYHSLLVGVCATHLIPVIRSVTQNKAITTESRRHNNWNRCSGNATVGSNCMEQSRCWHFSPSIQPEGLVLYLKQPAISPYATGTLIPCSFKTHVGHILPSTPWLSTCSFTFVLPG
jgi:hypothetical protein